MDRGYGFIKSADETDLFFHGNNLVGVEFNSLKEGQEVEFETDQDSKGRPQAIKVSLTETQTADDSGAVGDNGGDSSGDGDD